MYETVRIVGKLRPRYVIWENVKNILSAKHRHNFDNYLNTMASLGYKNYYQVLNAKDYGIPQNRERVFTISILEHCFEFTYNGRFKFPPKQELKLRLKDMLEEEVEDRYYLSDTIIKGFTKHNENHEEKGTGFILKPKSEDDIASCLRANAALCPTDNTIKCKQVGELDIKGHDCVKRVYSGDGLSPTLTDMQGGNRQPKVLIKNATKQGYQEAYEGDSVNLSYPNSNTRRGRVGNQVSQTLQCNDSMGVVENTRIRKLTPRECFRLMGFTDEEFDKASIGISNTQLYKMAGNSIVVNVLVEIFKNLFDDMEVNK